MFTLWCFRKFFGSDLTSDRKLRERRSRKQKTWKEKERERTQRSKRGDRKKKREMCWVWVAAGQVGSKNGSGGRDADGVGS